MSVYQTNAQAQAEKNKIIRQFTSGVIGTVTPDVNSIPQINGIDITVNGFYKINTTGTYGGILVDDLVNKLAYLEVRDIDSAVTYAISYSPLDLPIEPVAAENSVYAAQSGDLYNEKIKIAALQAKPANNITDGEIANWNASVQFYGVEWDTTAATTEMTRIGNLDMHRQLPIHSKMRRCLLNDDGTVNYYLSATNSLKKEDNVTNAVLDGSDGMVMVEIPTHYRKFETEGTKQRVLISTVSLAGYTKINKSYISAYEATVERSTSKLASVVNTSVDFRGGNNSARNDAENNTLLGMPASSLSRTNFRNYARNRGSVNWNCYLHEVRKTVFWLYYVEFAQMNCQTDFNASLTAQGFKQGGLGLGVTDAVSGDWSTFNGHYPFIPCGATNSLGNASGNVAYSPAGWADNKEFTVPSFRGIENPFGHIWEWVDGINLKIQSVAAGDKSEVYVADSLTMSDDDYVEYTKVGEVARVNGYIKELILNNGEILPKITTGASATTFWSDYFYTSIPETGDSLRGVLSGGGAYVGSFAGFGCSYAYGVPSYASANVGSRLCFVQQE